MRLSKKSKRIEVYNKYNGKCAYCGCDINVRQMQVDHIVPRSYFIDHITKMDKVPVFLRNLTITDIDHIDNLNPACGVCNKWKSDHHLELFRSEIEAQVKRLNEYSASYRMAKRYGLINENEIKIKFYFEQFKN